MPRGRFNFKFTHLLEGKKKLILPLKKRRKACEVKNLPTKKKRKRKGNEKYGSLQNYKYIMDI